MYKIEEGQNSDSEEEKDFVPAMIPSGSRRRDKETSLDAEREAIENMYSSMMDIIRKTSEDIESRLDFEESKDVFESNLESFSEQSSTFLSGSKLLNSSKLVNQYSMETPVTSTQSKVLNKFSREEDRRLDKIAADAQAFLKSN